MKRRHVTCAGILNAAVNILLTLVLAAALLLFVPKLMGMGTFAVLSGSMEPTLPVGSLIFTQPCGGIGDIRKQDIIASHAGDVLVTHRAVAVDENAGTITTQGDANKVPDETPVKLEDVIGKVRFHIPFLGYLLMTIQTREGKTAVCLAAAGVLVLSICSNLKRKKEETI